MAFSRRLNTTFLSSQRQRKNFGDDGTPLDRRPEGGTMPGKMQM
ncbi:hypothetical protein SNOG_10022 [Parastagonospora nodorum SN15]|uniref:Uncharacterized protein n=1 Tax=Phaeosphaeria nodorum (strain SN15 / ATCC MYA-4574 / FGSC 10173) TaxID=321614 RepID=Q0UDZ2_PHANO|nr:hypothetical protein SNOG_10022 [Parastagonospora nodorum SN15]EAT82357.1 hypothetical protein SNOG_10022 [Parastagonospora nodorum SN15]